ncbi:MAG: hypothetical protein ABI824_08135 [Acidobacteriota bacterium]
MAQRLLAYEAAAGNGAEPSEFVGFRVCNKLRQPLCTLTGIARYRMLLSRALTLAKAEAPSLCALQLAADGSLQGLEELGVGIDKDQIRQAGVILVARLLGVFLTSIGEGAMLRLVASEILPHDSFYTTGNIRTAFDAILSEVDELQGVSTRLAELAEEHPPVTQALLTIAGNVQSTATLLTVLVAIKSPKPN